MPNIVITGAASGLGRAFTVLYASAATDATHIYAVDAAFPSADAAKTFAGGTKPEPWLRAHVHQYTVDVTSAEDVAGFGALLDMDAKPVDLLVYCVGVRGLVPGHGTDTARAESLDVMDAQTMEATFRVNTVGAFLFVRACVPGLRRAAGSKDGKEPKAVVLGSRVGSMADNSSGGGYAYRASKAALHCVVRSLSVDVPEAVWAVLHPGIVRTNLQPPGTEQEGAQDPMDAAGMLRDVVEGLGRKDSGRFVDRFGKDLPW